MADRVLRGSRLGSTSYEADRNHDLAPRRTATYRCPRDHEFAVPMADDADVPAAWDCRMHGLESTLVDGSAPDTKPVKPPRTHWDMLLERRSIEELEEILKERLNEVKTKRTAL
ncbi:MAG: RNA polymerase-binding protein RbpA [Nakamurella sp.]